MGAKNKRTLENERVAAQIAERTVADARTAGKRLAKEVLEEFMFLFAGMAATYQPMPPNAPLSPTQDEPKFERYAKLAIECAHKLAPYQSPTFQAVAVMTPTPEVRETLMGQEIANVNDPITLSRVYRKLIQHVR